MLDDSVRAHVYRLLLNLDRGDRPARRSLARAIADAGPSGPELKRSTLLSFFAEHNRQPLNWPEEAAAIALFWRTRGDVEPDSVPTPPPTPTPTPTDGGSGGFSVEYDPEVDSDPAAFETPAHLSSPEVGATDDASSPPSAPVDETATAFAKAETSPLVYYPPSLPERLDAITERLDSIAEWHPGAIRLALASQPHPELAERLDSITERLDSIAARVDALNPVEGIPLTPVQSKAILAVANRATAIELDQEVGLDVRAADNIVEQRPFETIEVLAKVPYVGPAALHNLRSYVAHCPYRAYWQCPDDGTDVGSAARRVLQHLVSGEEVDPKLTRATALQVLVSVAGLDIPGKPSRDQLISNLQRMFGKWPDEVDFEDDQAVADRQARMGESPEGESPEGEG